MAADREQLQAVFGTPSPVALITGSGAKRVGRAIAIRLASEGYRVAIHANGSMDEAHAAVAELRVAGASAEAFQADLRSEDQTRALVDRVHAFFGRLDALVNAAAIWPTKSLESTTADDVREAFEVNTVGTFVCAQQAGLKMAAQPTGGAIVNIGDWAIARPYAGYAAYFPSKGAIPTLTRMLAVEFAERNPRVRVNCVLPGPVMLPSDLSESERAAAIGGTLVKREGTPQHVADAVAFLLANDFITGVSLPVDGGRTICG